MTHIVTPPSPPSKSLFFFVRWWVEEGRGGKGGGGVDEVVDRTEEMALPPAQRVPNWSFKMGRDWQAKLIRPRKQLRSVT